MTQLNAQIEAEHSSAAESAIASPSRNDYNAMARSDHTLFIDKLRAYCMESKQHEAASRRQDLAHKVRYICNDLELILAELQSPAFTEFNPTQKHWLQKSQTAVQNAMHHLDLTNQACHYVPTK